MTQQPQWMHFFFLDFLAPANETNNTGELVIVVNLLLLIIFHSKILELHKIYSSWKLRWKYKFGLKESHLPSPPSLSLLLAPFAHFISKPQNYWLKLFDKAYVQKGAISLTWNFILLYFFVQNHMRQYAGISKKGSQGRDFCLKESSKKITILQFSIFICEFLKN